MNSESRTVPIEILLVEDNPADSFLMNELLIQSRVPNRVQIAIDGEDALEYLKRDGKYRNAVLPDIILLDLNLPRSDGKQLLEIIKKDNSFRSIPVIVLTTSQSNEDVLTAYKLGANCYIAKPMNLARLKKVVKELDEFWFSMVQLPSRPSSP